MPAFLLKLIPLRDWLYAGLAVAVLILWIHHNHVEQAKGAAAVASAVQTATNKANTAAQAKIDKLTADHADDVAQIEDRYENTIRDNDTTHAADLQRLRDRAARDSSTNQVLDSSISGEATSQAGAGGTESLGSVPAERALDLADALRADDAALDKCYADRDSLTGK